jgi:hypothetical protein
VEAPVPDDAALAALVQEAAADEAPERHVDFYGFADFSYFHPLMSPDSPWTWVLREYPAFAVGSLNAYVDATLAPKLRSLIEVRFLYSPQGELGPIAEGKQSAMETTVRDPVDYGRTIRWGGVLVERAWLEYEVRPWLVVRGGQFLTPYGIWNVDHGSPTIIGIRRPYGVGEQLLPERQTGLELYGASSQGDLRLGYHLTLSNGRGPVDALRDFDTNKAVGARVFAERRGGLAATLGLSLYRGRYTNQGYRYTSSDGFFVRERVIQNQFDELALGVDLRASYANFVLHGEGMLNDRGYTEAGRQRSTLPAGSLLIPDGRRWGAYALVGYRTPLFRIMPYVLAEIFRPREPVDDTWTRGPIPTLRVGYVGINARPVASTVLKLEFAYGDAPGARIADGARLRVLQAQVAWAF